MAKSRKTFAEMRKELAKESGQNLNDLPNGTAARYSRPTSAKPTVAKRKKRVRKTPEQRRERRSKISSGRLQAISPAPEPKPQRHFFVPSPRAVGTTETGVVLDRIVRRR